MTTRPFTLDAKPTLAPVLSGLPTTLLILLALVWLPPSLMAQSSVSADGVIESRSGGFKFPDGSVQTTATEVADPCANPNDPADEMIRVSGVCIDKYEASVWSQPDGGMQYGLDADGDFQIDPGTEYPCSENGQDCFGLIYARSVPGVQPSAFITWFQAQAALSNSGKRLPTNAEWQMAVLGTPDPGDTPGSEDCNVTSSIADPTGERASCISTWGHHDMVGNLSEAVADWGDDATSCTRWTSNYGDDVSCIGLGEGQTNSRLPGALFRGGSFIHGAAAGPFAVSVAPPSGSAFRLGFRGAR